VTLVDAAGIGVTLVTEKLRCAAGIGFTVMPEKLRFVPVLRVALGLIGILCNTPGITFMPAILAYLAGIMHSLSLAVVVVVAIYSFIIIMLQYNYT
jgi:hypothetical protein